MGDELLWKGMAKPQADAQVQQGPGAENCPWFVGTPKKYSVKLDYQAAVTQHAYNGEENWKSIWLMKGPQRLNLFLWQTRCDKIVTTLSTKGSSKTAQFVKL